MDGWTDSEMEQRARKGMLALAGGMRLGRPGSGYGVGVHSYVARIERTYKQSSVGAEVLSLAQDRVCFYVLTEWDAWRKPIISIITNI